MRGKLLISKRRHNGCLQHMATHREILMLKLMSRVGGIPPIGVSVPLLPQTTLLDFSHLGGPSCGQFTPPHWGFSLLFIANKFNLGLVTDFSPQ